MRAGLGREDIRALLDDLSAELAARGARAELFLVGGAALAVAYDATRATRDLDAVFGSALAAGGGSAGNRLSAGGNIAGRRRAVLMARDSGLCGWRCACCGRMPRRAACTAGFGTMGPEGFQLLCLSCNDSKGTGGRCTLAHIDGEKRCYARNEIKQPEREPGTDRTVHDGHARAASCATPQPEQ